MTLWPKAYCTIFFSILSLWVLVSPALVILDLSWEDDNESLWYPTALQGKFIWKTPGHHRQKQAERTNENFKRFSATVPGRSRPKSLILTYKTLELHFTKDRLLRNQAVSLTHDVIFNHWRKCPLKVEDVQSPPIYIMEKLILFKSSVSVFIGQSSILNSATYMQGTVIISP